MLHEAATDSEIRQQYDQKLLAIYAPPSPVFVRASGCSLWDETGKDYIDLGGGIAVLSLGHCPPILTKAIASQATQLMHISNLHVNAVAVELAQLLVAKTFAKQVFLCNSGTEANEAAIKLARHYGVCQRQDKYQTLSFYGGFHGRTGMAMAASPSPKVQQGFGPLAPGFRFSAYNDIEAAKAQMDETVCAILVEPIQGEGGVWPATPDFLHGLRALADEYQALLIYDEIQSGAGRTGYLYAYMQDKVLPDVLTTAKGLGGGFPLAAMLVGERAVKVLSVGQHGTTFGGNPLAARAAITVLEKLSEEGFLEEVRQKSQHLAEFLQRAQKKHDCFSDIRQVGLWVGADMAPGWVLKEVVSSCLAQGLVVITAGHNTLRLAPPLTISLSQMEAAFFRFDRALSVAQVSRETLEGGG